MKHLLLAAACVCWAGTGASAAQVNVADIVNRSAAAMDRDWEAAPDNYSYVERDVESKRGAHHSSRRTAY